MVTPPEERYRGSNEAHGALARLACLLEPPASRERPLNGKDGEPPSGGSRLAPARASGPSGGSVRVKGIRRLLGLLPLRNEPQVRERNPRRGARRPVGLQASPDAVGDALPGPGGIRGVFLGVRTRHRGSGPAGGGGLREGVRSGEEPRGSLDRGARHRRIPSGRPGDHGAASPQLPSGEDHGNRRNPRDGAPAGHSRGDLERNRPGRHHLRPSSRR